MFTLGIVGAGAAQTDTESGADRGDSHQSRDATARTRILVVEDNPGDVAIVRALLRPEPVEIDWVETAQAGRERLIAGSFDAVLLDLCLPDGNGVEVVDKLLPVAARAPIVVLTGREDDALVFDCLDAGAYDYVRKADLNRRSLWRIISHAVARHRDSELARRLEVAERHAAVGQLAAVVAHEVSNQVAVLLADMELAAAVLDRVRESPGHDSAEAVAELQYRMDEGGMTARRIADIVGELKGLSRVDVDGVEDLDPVEAVRRSLNLLASGVRQRAALVTELSPCSPVTGNPRKLEQVVLNLLRNAIDAIEPGAPDSHQVSVRTLERDRQVLISVSDTGGGIGPAHRERLFEPFFTTKPRARGTGLGLAICRELIAAMGGTIEVDSELGAGATFTLRLPAATSVRPRDRSVHTPPSRVRGARHRVLLVDDDARLREVLIQLLRTDHDVVALADGREALAQLDDGVEFDAVLCDLMMPGYDGVDLCQDLQRDHPHMLARVALLSGGGFYEKATEFLARTELPVLPKPCRRADLLAMIARLATTTET